MFKPVQEPDEVTLRQVAEQMRAKKNKKKERKRMTDKEQEENERSACIIHSPNKNTLTKYFYLFLVILT